MNKFLICMLLLGLGVSKLSAQSNFTTRFTAQKRYLQIPIKNGAPTHTVKLLLGGEELRWFSAELATGQADWFAVLDISPWKGKELTLAVDTDQALGQAFSPLTQVDSIDRAHLYKEARRGQFHFSPQRGWMNDPNGLVYYKDEYHLFFQHNPYGVNWGNMHWGHAVSTDLIHWKELGEALYPDSWGTMFSGGAVLDTENRSALGSKAGPPLLLFYTAAEKSWTQGLAYSTDGRSFKKLAGPVLGKVTDGNRDPKVIWHAPSKKWVMVVYVAEAGEQHSMYFYTSPDAKAWVFASKVYGGRGNDRYLFECPEFFELPVLGAAAGETRWVLTGANSQYAVGTFDGQQFKPEEERMFSQQGRDYYAAQTFSNEPQGRRIEIGWWRTDTRGGGSSFNQSMSVPMELSLQKTGRGIRLVRTPVEALKQLRTASSPLSTTALSPSSANPLEALNGELAELRLRIRPESANTILIAARGLDIQYQVADAELVVDNVRAHVPLLDGLLDLTIYVDRIGVEIFAAQGQVFMPINYNLDAANRSYSIRVAGGDAKLESGEFHTLQSIWNK